MPSATIQHQQISTTTLQGTPEHTMASMDARIARLYYGCGPSHTTPRSSTASATASYVPGPSSSAGAGYSPRHAAMAASARRSIGRATTPRSSPASVSPLSRAGGVRASRQTPSASAASLAGIREKKSPAVRSSERLHRAMTISSTLSSRTGADLDSCAEGALKLDGSTAARSVNNFVWQLRRPPSEVPLTPASPAEGLASVLGRHSSPPRSTYGGSSTTSVSSPSKRPSSRCGSPPSQAQSVGTREQPPGEIVFGSARIQRPERALIANSLQIPKIGEHGELHGIY